MNDTIDTLRIKVEGESQSAVKSLDSLINTLERIKGATASKSIGTLTSKLDKLKSSINDIKTKNLSKLNSIFSTLSNGNKINISPRLPERIRELGEAVGSLNGVDFSKLNEMAAGLSALSRVGRVRLPRANGGRRGTTTDTSVDDSTVGMERNTVLGESLDKAKSFSNKLKDIWTHFKKGDAQCKKYGETIRKTFDSTLLGRFYNKVKEIVRSFARIALYRIMRSIMRQITEGFKTGMDNMYQYSKTFNGRFAQSMDKAASALLSFKNSIGAAIAPIIEQLVPWLDKAVDKFMEINNTIAMVLAGLAGKTTYSKAVRVTTEYAEAANKAADNTSKIKDKVEEVKKSFAGMDEITVIGDNAAAAMSDIADATDTGVDYSSMFVETPVDMAKVNEIVDKFKEIWKWAKLIGAVIAGWNIGKALSSLFKLGGLKSLLATAGSVIAGIGALLEYEGLSDILKNGIDWENMLKSVLGGALVVAGAALIGLAFGNAFLGAAIGAIVAGIPMFVVGIIDAVKEGINEKSALLIAAGSTLAGAGIGFLIGGPVGALVGGLIGLAVGALTDLGIWVAQNWDQVCAWCSQAIEDIGQFFVDCWDWICGVWGSAATWFDTNVIQPIVGFFTGIWDGVSTAASNCWDWISTTASNCWSAVVTFFSPATEWFSKLFGSIFQTTKDIFHNIGVIASGCWEIIKRVWGIVSVWFDDKIIKPVSTFFSGLWEGIRVKAVQAWDGIKLVFSTIKDWIHRNIIQPVGDFFVGLWNGFEEKAAQAWVGVKLVFSKVGQFFGDTFRDAWSKVVKVFSVAGDIFVKLKDGIVEVFKRVVNGIISGINFVIAIPFNAINDALSWIRGLDIAGWRPFEGLVSINVPEIPLLANGGILNAGTAFIAGEAGPEVVGNIGSRTGVMNTEQMEESVARGVESAMAEQNAILKEQNRILYQLLSKEFNIGVSTITSALNRKNQRDGKVTVPVSI